MPLLDVSDHELDMVIASVLLKGETLCKEIRAIKSKARRRGRGEREPQVVRKSKAGEMVAHYERKQKEYDGLVSKLRRLHNGR